MYLSSIKVDFCKVPGWFDSVPGGSWWTCFLVDGFVIWVAKCKRVKKNMGGWSFWRGVGAS